MIKTEDKAGIFSFFAGAGFLDLGFENTGFFDILFVNELHRAFMDIYQHSRNAMNINAPQYGYSLSDITTFLNEQNLEELRLKVTESSARYKLIGFIGGPPCPDFSIAGKNRGKKGENGKLSETYIDLICNIQPDFFLFENVKGLYRTKKHRIFFDHLKTKLRKSGYCLTENLINAIEFGAPQDRERIILIGFHKRMQNKWNIKTSNGNLADFGWDDHKLYAADKIFDMPWPETTQYVENSCVEMPENIIRELTVEHWFEQNDVNNHPNRNRFFTPRNGILRFREIAEGDDKKKSYKRLHRWRYSPTAAYGNNEVHLHPYQSRRISAAEALALQSLPQNFILPNNLTLTDTFKAIGNGVPYMAAKGLALSIYDHIVKLEKHGEINSK